MNLTKSITTAAMSIALLGGFVATPALADLPKAPAKISVMDTNNNGRIEKDEFLAYMSSAFDQRAGTKGYCTFEEVQAGFDDLHKMIIN
jgi:hypothetical protein